MAKKRLNQQQLKAIQHKKGPLLIIAGAGTGKTTVVTERIKYLISQKLAKPAEILALTFTSKAAQEMEERVDQAMPYGHTQMWISTFHSFCDRILHDEAVHIGLSSNFALMTEAETLLFLRRHLFDLPIDYFRPQGNPVKFLNGLSQHFNRLRDEDVSPNDYLHWVKTKNSKQESKKHLELAKAFEKYQKLKIKENKMDFADLIANVLLLFRKRPIILQQYQNQFKYLLVDEFQDTNIAQNELVILLAGKKKNITVCSDDDQAIYRWRGAAISNVIQFKNRFPKTKIVVLTQNYRSTQNILNASYQLIQFNNPDRLEVREKINKKLTSVRKIKGEKVKLIFVSRVENEAEAVVKKIKSLKNNYDWKDFAILVRANNHAQPFIQALLRSGIPYQFLGPGRLLKQPEIKDLIAYLKVLDNFEDDVALFRILTMDILKLSARDLAAIRNFSRQNHLSFFEGCEEISQQESSRPRPRINQISRKKIKQIVKMIHRHLELIPKETSGQILYFFLKETGLLKKLTNAKTIITERQALNISKFFDQLKTYEANHEDASIFPVVDWLNMKINIGESPLAADMDWTGVNAVNILTIHSAKGLEFPVVFLINLVSQRFPSIHRREQIPLPEEIIKEILPEGDYHQQEERRLFYVGMTRARDKLYLTAANYYGEGKREKKLSLFIYEALGKTPDQILSREKNKQLSFLDFKPSPILDAKRLTLNAISSLSYSQINTFNTCPQQYKYQYILRIPTPPSAAQSFGSSIHQALGDFYQAILAKNKVQEKDLLIALKRRWFLPGYSSKKHEQKMFNKAKKILKDFYQNSYDPQVIPIALEQFFSLPLNRYFKVVGRIDRVDRLKNGCLEIIDYKTGKPKTKKEADKDLQMTIYALAASDKGIYNQKPEKIILSFLFLGESEKISSQRTKQQLNDGKNILIKKAQEIQKSDFLPTPGKLCDFCEYKLLCEAWQ